MSTNPIRLGTAAISGRIFAGRPTKDGRGFKEPRHDVTSDALRCISEHVGIGNEITVHCDGEPAFRIAVLPAQAIEARRAETHSGSVHERAVGSADAPNPIHTQGSPDHDDE